jgi:hypothetical protein
MTDKQHFPWHLPHPIDSLSLVNKKMRNVSLTSVYEKSIVRKDLSNVVSSLERKMTRRIFLVDVLKSSDATGCGENTGRTGKKADRGASVHSQEVVGFVSETREEDKLDEAGTQVETAQLKRERR